MTLDKLEALRSRLFALGLTAAEYFGPGRQASEVRDALEGAPEPVVEWFTTYDGLGGLPPGVVGDAYVIPGYTLPSLSEAISLRRVYASDPALSTVSSVPLLANYSGDLYVAAWQGGGESVFGVLTGEETVVEYSSIDEMLDVFLSAFDGGAFFVGVDGMLTMYPDAFDALHE